MKRLFKILSHPILFCAIVRDKERMCVFHCACTLLGIQKPTVWDVDRINEMTNKVMSGFHDSNSFFTDSKTMWERLGWTLLVSKFKRISVPREVTKQCLDLYNNVVSVLSKEDVTVEDATIAHEIMVSNFENFV